MSPISGEGGERISPQGSFSPALTARRMLQAQQVHARNQPFTGGLEVDSVKGSVGTWGQLVVGMPAGGASRAAEGPRRTVLIAMGVVVSSRLPGSVHGTVSPILCV